jgi:hypothetical protein
MGFAGNVRTWRSSLSLRLVRGIFAGRINFCARLASGELLMSGQVFREDSVGGLSIVSPAFS